jgi:copper chaperone CopZ
MMSDVSTARLLTTGMHCQSCSMLVQMELEDLAGVVSATSDFVTGMTQVEYMPDQITVDDLVAAVVRAGYGAQPV